MTSSTVVLTAGHDRAISQMRLSPLLASRRPRAEVRVGIVDGGVDARHPDLANATVRDFGPAVGARQAPRSSHATFVAGVICADEGSRVPGICPTAHVWNCPVASRRDGTPDELDTDSTLTAIEVCLTSSVMILNLSLELIRPSPRIEQRFNEAMDYAASRGVLVVRAAGNNPNLSGGLGPRHSWPLPVVAYLGNGRASNQTPVGTTLGQHGVGGPGGPTLGLGLAGGYQFLQGTSVATAYVSAALALLWSIYPRSSAAQIRRAVDLKGRARRAIPPLLDMSAMYRQMERT
jgi:subtilisin family serine protease